MTTVRCRLCDKRIPPRTGPGRPPVWCSERCRHEAELEIKKAEGQVAEYLRRRAGLKQQIDTLDEYLKATRFRLAGLTGRQRNGDQLDYVGVIDHDR